MPKLVVLRRLYIKFQCVTLSFCIDRAAAFEFFLHGKSYTLTAKHLAKSKTVSLSLGSANFSRPDIPFDDTASVLPQTLDDEESGSKALVDWDSEKKAFILDVNGEPYECLPFLDTSFCLDEKNRPAIGEGKVYVNEQII